MNRDEERTPRAQRRTAYEDRSIYEIDTANAAPRRRRSQAARLQMQEDEPREAGSPYGRESNYVAPREGRARAQLPERPRMRQLEEDFEIESRYRPQRQTVKDPSVELRDGIQPLSRRMRPIEELDDDPDDDLFDYQEKKTRKSSPVKWIILTVLVLGIIGGGAYLSMNRHLVDPLIQKVFQVIGGATPTPAPTEEPTPAPTEEPPPPLEMASVNGFSVIPEGEIQANTTVQFRVETSNLTDRITIVDGNGQQLIQLAGEDQYIDTDEGRIWNVMYTFIAPYEGILEVSPGNESGWNEASGSQIDIIVIDSESNAEANVLSAVDDSQHAVTASETQPSAITLESQVIDKTGQVEEFSRAQTIQFGAAGEYATPQTDKNGMNGVLTFRGDNLRQNAAHGTITAAQKTLQSVWELNVGVPGDGSRMWNVQPVIAQWPQVIREKMNLLDEKSTKSLLKEVVFASNDSKVYFIDLEDGSSTREKISFQNPALSLLATPAFYPNGSPMMFVGTGDPAYLAEDSNQTGMYIYDLMSEKIIKLIAGTNEYAHSTDATFITSPLIDRDTTVVLSAGGNGILYTTTLNLSVDPVTLVPSMVAPTTEMYIATPTSSGDNAATIYSAYAAYDGTAYIATQGGVLLAVDLNTLKTVWALDLGQETDAAVSVDPDASGGAALYVASRPDTNGKSHIRRIDASTGSVTWDVEIDGAVSASLLVGTNTLSEWIYVAAEEPSVLYALSKADGQPNWVRPLSVNRASSPIALYGEDGAGYVVHGDDGAVFLLDGTSGEEYSSLTVEGNVVGSPAAFEDMITFATSAGKLYGIQVQ